MEEKKSEEQIKELQPKEPNKAEIQKILKSNILRIYKQIKTGCCRKICYNIYCAKNSLCRKIYGKSSNEKIFKELMLINQSMINVYNTYDNLDKFICNENEEILKLEKKFDSFSINLNYNYLSNKNQLPDINLDLTKIVKYYKNSSSNSLDELIKEISAFNNYFDTLTKNINITEVQALKEQSILYYLFYFMSRAFFYIILSNNFMVTKGNSIEYTKFFSNYRNILNICKAYIKDDISNNNIILDKNEKNDFGIEKKIKKAVYIAFKNLRNYKNEFKDAIISCQNFLILILFSAETEQQDKNLNPFLIPPNTKLLDKEMFNLLEIFVINLDFFYKINLYFSIIDYKVFYNDGMSKKINFRNEFKIYLTNEKIKEEYKKQKNGDKKDKLQLKFTLLNYMWLFNPSAKNEIIILFNNRQRRSEFMKSINQAPPLLGLPLFVSANDVFLTINIRRKNLIEDALNELSKKDIKLQNPIKVRFLGEQGVDEGGVRKEFFLLFIRQIFDPNYGMFNYNEKTRLYWFNHYTFEPKIKYELIGIIFGLAIYNNIILDVKFPLTVYRKLLGLKPTLEDMKECDPELYKNFSFLKKTKDANLKESLDLDFTVTDDKFGEKLVIPLKKDGDKISVDINNKDEYVDLYLDWYFNKSIQEVFTSFEKGFYRVFSRDLSKILSPEELELIICGTQVLDFNELKRVCKYEEYNENDETIKYFWEVLLNFSEDEKKRFLSFVTGCDRAPIDGLGSLPITISNGGSDVEQLPSAHTCFNNLILPNYKNKEKLKKNMLNAINYSEGFGLI